MVSFTTIDFFAVNAFNLEHFKTLSSGKRKGINPLPDLKILDWSILTGFVVQMMIFVFDKEENIVANGENAVCQHFFFFSHNVFKGLDVQCC